MAARAATVVVDTNVFSADLLRASRPLVELYRPILTGRRFLISFQTAAEIEYGVRRRNWGPVRVARVEDHIALGRDRVARTGAPVGLRRPPRGM